MPKLSLYFILSTLIFADFLPFQTIDKANRAYEKGEYKKSAKLFNSLEQNDSTVKYNEANALYKAGLYDKALNAYDKAEGIDEMTRQYNMGNSYFKKGELKRAIACYEEALKMGEDEDTRYNLALAKRRVEEKKKQEQKAKEKSKSQ